MGELFHFPANYKGFLVTLSFGGHLARDLFKFAIFGGISHPFLDPDQVLTRSWPGPGAAGAPLTYTPRGFVLINWGLPNPIA